MGGRKQWNDFKITQKSVFVLMEIISVFNKKVLPSVIGHNTVWQAQKRMIHNTYKHTRQTYTMANKDTRKCMTYNADKGT